MSFSVKDIEKLSNLAKIDIHEESSTVLHDFAEGLPKHLNAIMELIDQIEKKATDNIEPMAHPLDMAQPLREDATVKHESRTELQTITPEANIAAGLYLVPKVVE